MKKIKILFLALLIITLTFGTLPTKAETLAARFSGYIMLQVEANGEAWYVYPNDLQRYFLGRPADAFAIMRTLGLGATHDFIESHTIFPASVSGKILLDVEQNGEAYYIYPKDMKKYYLGRPADAFTIMRQLSIGISNDNLALIPAANPAEKTNQPQEDSYSSYEVKQVTVNNSTFEVKTVQIDLQSPGLRIITDTAFDNDCDNNCPAKPLADYANDNNAFAAIHGSYFCAADYASCANSLNYFFYPVYNTKLDKMMNEDQLKWPTTGPILIFDQENNPYFILSTQDVKDLAVFEADNGIQIQAAIGNQPALVFNQQNILDINELDNKQQTVKSLRGAIGIKDSQAYLMIASDATVIDLADIMMAMQMDYAMNLDGGGSSALIYQGDYKVGPGRDLPNAIIFSK